MHVIYTCINTNMPTNVNKHILTQQNTNTHTKVFYIYIAIITFSIVKIPIYFLRCNE